MTVLKLWGEWNVGENVMKAGVFQGNGVLAVVERPVPGVPAPDWVVIENEGCGVCGTDLHILAVPPGIEAVPGVVLGHEMVGRVVAVGPAVTQFRVGDRVTVAPNLMCGVCRHCKAGRHVHCENWTTLGIHKDGGFAPYTAAPERALHRISPHVPFADAVWAEPLSCVVNGTDRLGVQPGQVAVVIGAGPIGALHALLFKAAGARVIIADVSPLRLEVCRQAGVDVTVDVREQDLVRVVMDQTDGLGAEVVVDAVGNQFPTCIQVAARRGQISLFGMNGHALPQVRQYDITRNELVVYGSYVGAHSFPRAIQILESGVLRPSVLNSLLVPLEELPEAIGALRQGRAMKVVVRF